MKECIDINGNIVHIGDRVLYVPNHSPHGDFDASIVKDIDTYQDSNGTEYALVKLEKNWRYNNQIVKQNIYVDSKR